MKWGMDMKKSCICFIVSFLIILFSAPLGRCTLNILYHNKNLCEEYGYILNGFIHSFMIIGVLIFIVGVIKLFTCKKICCKNS